MQSTPVPGQNAVGSFTLFAFKAGTPDSENYRRGRLSEKRLWAAVQAAIRRDCNIISIQLVEGVPAIPDGNITHHVCSDGDCPGGC